MTDTVRRLREAVIEHALRGQGLASVEARRAAFDNIGVDERVRSLVDKVSRHAWKVTDADIADARAEGLSEQEIFELTICAALGQSTRQLETALAAVDAATRETR
jgi:alkylhydroperoxidase family enzyme